VAEPQPCDFCGAPVVWTPSQVQLDLSLKLLGSPHCTGLGVMCDDCDNRQIEIYQREEAELEEREAEELRALEGEEMARHYREHPHG